MSMVIRQAGGKYVALCEGDDFWIDKNKLAQQLSLMGKILSVSFVFTQQRFLLAKKLPTTQQ